MKGNTMNNNFALAVRALVTYFAIITAGKAVKNAYRHTGKLAHRITSKS